MKSIKSMLLPFAMAMAVLQNGVESLGKEYPGVNVDPSWKRKKCKSCIRCGMVCSPKGRHPKHSRPTDSACKDYKAKKK